MIWPATWNYENSPIPMVLRCGCRQDEVWLWREELYQYGVIECQDCGAAWERDHGEFN